MHSKEFAYNNIHARLDHFIKNASLKYGLGYYKPHTIDKNNKVKYAPGEIDFILKKGKKILPIEVTSQHLLELFFMEEFRTRTKKINFDTGLIG